MFDYCVMNIRKEVQIEGIIYRFSLLDKIQKNNTKSYQQKNNKFFQCAVTVPLNYEEIKEGPQRITKVKTFTNKCYWKGINCPSEKGDWKKIEKNKVKVAFNVLFAKKEKIYS